MENNDTLKIFFQQYPLYKAFKIVEDYSVATNKYNSPFDFKGETFTYYCEKEQENKTFEIELENKSAVYWGSLAGDRVPAEVLKEDNRLDYVHHFEGNCKSCRDFKVHFLLHIWSDIALPDDYFNQVGRKVQRVGGRESDNKKVNIFIEKVGVDPAPKVAINKELTKCFDRESASWYYKAKKSLMENYGIGSLSYFRRIIEKELIKIIYDLSNLQFSDSNKILALIKEYEKSKKVYLLYESVYQYLPVSLKSLGENPFKVLYQQTSEGLHNLSEEESLKRSQIIDMVLCFVVKKLNEEKSEIYNIRNAIKGLK